MEQKRNTCSTAVLWVKLVACFTGSALLLSGCASTTVSLREPESPLHSVLLLRTQDTTDAAGFSGWEKGFNWRKVPYGAPMIDETLAQWLAEQGIRVVLPKHVDHSLQPRFDSLASQVMAGRCRGHRERRDRCL